MYVALLLYVWDKNYSQIMSPLRLKVGGNVPPGPMVAPPMTLTASFSHSLTGIQGFKNSVVLS